MITTVVRPITIKISTTTTQDIAIRLPVAGRLLRGSNCAERLSSCGVGVFTYCRRRDSHVLSPTPLRAAGVCRNLRP